MCAPHKHVGAGELESRKNSRFLPRAACSVRLEPQASIIWTSTSAVLLAPRRFSHSACWQDGMSGHHCYLTDRLCLRSSPPSDFICGALPVFLTVINYFGHCFPINWSFFAYFLFREQNVEQNNQNILWLLCYTQHNTNSLSQSALTW